MADFDVCPHGEPCRRAAAQLQGAESAAIVQRLDELMRECREDGHRITYQDLVRVREGEPPRPAALARLDIASGRVQWPTTKREGEFGEACGPNCSWPACNCAAKGDGHAA